MKPVVLVIILIIIAVVLGILLACLVAFLEIKDTDPQKKSGELGDKAVTKEFRKILGRKAYIMENPIFYDPKGMSYEIDHVIISRRGIFVITSMDFTGTLDGNHNSPTWVQHYQEGGERTITNPIRDNALHMRVIKSLFAEELVMFGYVILVSNNSESIQSSQVIDLTALERTMEIYPEILPDNEVRALYDALEEKRAKISHLDHLENVRRQKERRL